MQPKHTQPKQMQPKQLGPYRIERLLGRGGMGAVYAAVAMGDGSRAAVKVLAAGLAHDDGFRERFAAEIETLRKLRHPNIVRLFGFGEEQETLFYSMELVDGTSLEDELRAGRRFDWEQTTRLGVQICRALRHAHDHGIVHRDLKPANLLLDTAGTLKLSDFGIAKLFGNTGMTAVGGVIGTAEYMSPEQAEGRPVTHRSDLYSLGAVLYALLSGRTPFRARSLPEMLHMQRYAEADPVRRYAPQTPVELDRIVGELLAKDPEARCPNAMILGRRLESMLHGMAQQSKARDVHGAATLVDPAQLAPGTVRPVTDSDRSTRDRSTPAAASSAVETPSSGAGPAERRPPASPAAGRTVAGEPGTADGAGAPAAPSAAVTPSRIETRFDPLAQTSELDPAQLSSDDATLWHETGSSADAGATQTPLPPGAAASLGEATRAVDERLGTGAAADEGDPSDFEVAAGASILPVTRPLPDATRGTAETLAPSQPPGGQTLGAATDVSLQPPHAGDDYTLAEAGGRVATPGGSAGSGSVGRGSVGIGSGSALSDSAGSGSSGAALASGASSASDPRSRADLSTIMAPPGGAAAEPVAIQDAESRRHFTTVEEANRAELERQRPKRELISPQTWALMIALVSVGVVVWWSLQPVSADRLYGRIEAAVDPDHPEQLLSAEADIATFLTQYPGDPRAGELRRYQEQIELERLERRIERRARLQQPAELLTPVEQAYFEAVRYSHLDADRGAAKLAALVALYGERSHTSPQVRQYVELAERRLERLRAQIERHADDELRFIHTRLDQAQQRAADDPAAARAIALSVVELYGDKSWAAEVVATARELAEQWSAAATAVSPGDDR